MIQPNPKRPGTPILLWILMAVPLAVVGLVVPMLLYTAYSSRNARFEIRREGLEISGSLYGRSIPREALAVDEAKIVNLASSEPSLQRASRTNGTSVPGWDEGWFRLSDGRKALLFVTDRSQVVYLPTTQGYLVLLSPMQAEMFLVTLRRGTNVPVSFQIAPSGSGALVMLVAAGLVPLLLIAPLVWMVLRQRRPFTGTTGADAIYADNLIEITADSILFRNYYFPVGAKRVWLRDIQEIQVRPMTLANGKWRIWGSGDFRTWFPADWYRPNRETSFLLIRKGKRVRIGFTVEDADAAAGILRKQGVVVG